MEKAKRGTRRKNCWDYPKLEEFIQTLIEGGVLRKPQALDEIVRAVRGNTELIKLLDRERCRFTKKSLQAKLAWLIWNTREPVLRIYVKEQWDFVGIQERFSYLPKKMLEGKVRFLRGRSHKKTPAPFVQGLFRVIPQDLVVKAVHVPETSLAKPVAIPDEVGGVMPVGALMIGSPYSGLMEENIPRCMMEFAEREHLAVVLTGGLFHLNTQQVNANTRNVKAMTSEIDIDLDVLDPLYRATAREIIESGKDTVIFVTFKESFETLLAGVKKIFFKSEQEGGGPRFSTVPTFLHLDASLIELIRALTTWEIRSEARLRLFQITQAKRKAMHVNQQDPDNETVADEFKRAVEEVCRSVLSNVAESIHKRAYFRMRSYILGRILDAIPGVQLIGSQESFISYRGKTMLIKDAGDDTRKKNLLNEYITGEGNEQTLEGEMADAIILVNRFTTHLDATQINRTYLGRAKYSIAMTLPPAIDTERVRAKFKDRDLRAKKQTPIQRFVADPLLQPGIIVLQQISQLLLLKSFQIPAIQYLGGPLARRTANKTVEKYLLKAVTVMMTSDLHMGQAHQRHFWDKDPDDKRAHGDIAAHTPVVGKLHDLTSAIMKIYRNEGALGRIHSWYIPDDLQHGANHAYHTETHRNVLSDTELREVSIRYRALIHKAYVESNFEEAERLLSEYDHLHLRQDGLKGLHRVGDQFKKLVYGLLTEGADVFANVITTYKRSGIELIGASKLTGEFKDTTDLKVISSGNGNHFQQKKKQGGEVHLSEGDFASEAAKARIMRHLPRRYHDELLKEGTSLIGAPYDGQDLLGLGIIDTKHGGKFGVYLRGSPARYGPSNGFGLVKTAINAIERGDNKGLFRGVETVFEFYGDKHKGSVSVIPKHVIVVCPAGTKDDAYGNSGFARSHVGGVLVSYPAVGMKYAPVTFTFIMEDWIDAWYNERFRVDFAHIIPEPL